MRASDRSSQFDVQPLAQGGLRDSMSMERTELPNGVVVLSEHIPGIRSVGAGVWVRQGSAHEEDEDSGASHLLEHMVFKGTRKRTAAEIALAIEGLGGSLDAYTSREHTSYQVRVLDEHLPEALDVLADLTLHPTLGIADLALEREVVLEEIAQVDDTPDDLVFELHADRMWEGHPYGRSILGRPEIIAEMPAELLRRLHGDRYRGGNLIVAAAGNVVHESFVEQVAGLFGEVDPGGRSERVVPPVRTRVGMEQVQRPSAQTHIVFGTPSPGHDDPGRFGLMLLSAALGGGMSSRLFQEVREKLGLCYSIHSYQSFYGAGGVLGVYVGTRPGTADRALDAVRAELVRLAEHALPEDELEQIKTQFKGQIMLSLESTGSRLHRLASFELHDEPFLTLDELLGKFDAVTLDEIRPLAQRYYDPAAQFVLALGPER